MKRDYLDPGSRANSSRLSEELGEIQNIMRKNIQEVLDRGEKLESECAASAVASTSMTSVIGRFR